MESIVALLEEGARDLTAAKYILISAAALTVYDFLLMFNDEIRYVWRGRKTWISYLYMLNRVLLMSFQIWDIYYTSNRKIWKNSKLVCLGGYYVQVILIMIFLSSSDIFIILRIYAISLGNKLLVGYFAVLALARFALSLASSLSIPPSMVELPRIPEIDAFDLCGLSASLRFKLVPNSIATAFELSAFFAIAWCTYRSKSSLRFSALVRKIFAEATLYFLVMVAAQTYVQLSVTLAEGISQDLSFVAYGLFNPVLTLRFAVSLRQFADPEGGEEWQVGHFSTVRFAPGGSPNSEVSSDLEDMELDPLEFADEVQTREA